MGEAKRAAKWRLLGLQRKVNWPKGNRKDPRAVQSRKFKTRLGYAAMPGQVFGLKQSPKNDQKSGQRYG